MKRFTAIILAITFLAIIVSTQAAHAQFNLGAAQGVGLPGGNLVESLGNIIKAFLGLVGVVALGYIVYGGFLYISAGGDEKQIGRAKQAITYAIVGIIVIGLAYALVTFAIGAISSGNA